MALVGCGNNSELSRLEAENKRLKAEVDNRKLKTQLEEENKSLKNLKLRLDFVGTYEGKFPSNAGDIRIELRENGEALVMIWLRGTITESDPLRVSDEWSVVHGELHLTRKSERRGAVFRVNRDKSITMIAGISDSGERGPLLWGGDRSLWPITLSNDGKELTLVKVKE